MYDSAVLYNILRHNRSPTSECERREALCACKRILRVHGGSEQLVKNAVVTLCHFSHEELVCYNSDGGIELYLVLKHDAQVTRFPFSVVVN